MKAIDKAEKPVRDRNAREGAYIFANTRQCAGAIGWPAAVLQAAKDAGCEAFKSNGRVNLLLFLRWYRKHGEKAKELLDGRQESSLLNKSRRIAQDIENAKSLELLHSLETVEERVWENGVLPLRSEIITFRKVIVAQVEEALERAGAQAVREEVRGLLCDGLDRMLAAARDKVNAKGPNE